MMADPYTENQQVITVQEAVIKEDDVINEDSTTVITKQDSALMGNDWSPAAIGSFSYCPPGFEILRNVESVHLKELVRLSDENHYHAFDQNDRNTRIYVIKGKDNWFAGESLSIYDENKKEILTVSTYTQNMLQTVTMFCPPGHKVLIMEKDVHFCRSIKYTVKSLNGEEIYNIASNQPTFLIPYFQSRKYNVVDCCDLEVARITVSSNICVTGDMIDLDFLVGLDVRIKAALLAATIIIIARGKNARQCHTALLEARGRETSPYRIVASIWQVVSPRQSKLECNYKM